MSPRVPKTYFTGEAGVIAVASVVNDARCIFRPVRMADVGIDGSIEHVDPEGRATGRQIYVQIKSGDSFFVRERDGRVSIPADRAASRSRESLAGAIRRTSRRRK